VPIDYIQRKKVFASFTRNNGTTVETGIGEIMVSLDSTGMCLGCIQFRDEVKQEWIHLYLNEVSVALLNKVDDPRYDFEIASVLNAAQQIGK
jgi:hypothetical protein